MDLPLPACFASNSSHRSVAGELWTRNWDALPPPNLNLGPKDAAALVSAVASWSSAPEASPAGPKPDPYLAAPPLPPEPAPWRPTFQPTRAQKQQQQKGKAGRKRRARQGASSDEEEARGAEASCSQLQQGGPCCL